MTTPDAPRPSIFETNPELLEQVKANVAAAGPLPAEVVELVQRVWPRPDEITPKQAAS